MSTTIVGCNRDPCNPGFPTKIDTLGVDVVTKDNDIVCIPAGWGVVSLQIKLVTQSTAPLAGTATNLQICADDGTTMTVVLTIPAVDLNAAPFVSLIGTDDSPIVNAANVEQGLKMKSDTGDFGPAGPTVCVTMKIKQMPVL
jgi:hypothetical protein